MNKKVKWGLLGTGSIAAKFAGGLCDSMTGELAAIGSRSEESARKFAAQFPAPHVHASYEALLADPTVDAVYISTPHPMHAEWTIKAADAGKHILCEKPITLNHAEAMAVVEAARRNDVFLMEAFMYRCHPQTAKIASLVQEGAIGEVRLIQANFSFRSGYNLESRLLKNALGGGGILDVGCYCASMARLIAGAAHGKACEEPISVTGAAHIGVESRVDEYAVASLEFPGGILAQLATGVQLGLDNVVRISGTAGSILIPSPWIVMRGTEPSKILLFKDGAAEPEEIVSHPGRSLYALEADTVAEHLAARQAPAMSWADSLGNMRTLDLWRQAIGLSYDSEKADIEIPTVSRRPLARRADHHMRYGTIAGIDKPVSRLVFGCDNQRTLPHASVVFDDWSERGGNAFDTAWLYGGGKQERLLGQWMRNRGIRDEVVVIGKGAHTPFCDPESITRQLHETLDRLQTDHVDLYLMHRDNAEIPAGEFVDVLNEHQRAGRIGVFGGSNWSIERVEEANAYAAKNGLIGFGAISNNLSLARMVSPVWRGCISVSDAESREWLTRTQMPVFGWSSQARGFFTDRADPDDKSDAEMVRCWYSPDNFQRRERAIEMAKKRGVLPINIALAYVLSQPFPSFPLFGPRVIEETRTSLGALDIELTPDDLAWLNLET